LSDRKEVDDASLLGEKVRRRDNRISETFMAYEEESEHEAVSAFLGLLSSATRYSLVIVNFNLIYLSLSFILCLLVSFIL